MEIPNPGEYETTVSKDNPHCVFFTPVYHSSPGTKFRIDQLKRSLVMHGMSPALIVGESESVLKNAYGLMAPIFLTQRRTLEVVGKHIAEQILKLSPDVAVLFTDVSSCAARHLRRRGVRTIVSVEDLTITYHKRIRSNPLISRKVMRLLVDELRFADSVITPSYMLGYLLQREYDIKNIVVPIGVDRIVSVEEATRREKKWALHVNRVDSKRQVDALTPLVADLRNNGIAMLLHESGKYAGRVKGAVPYRFATADLAIPYVKKAFLGVVADYGYSYTLASLYYHLGLLQPILARGSGCWIREARILGIPLMKDLLEFESSCYQQLSRASSTLRIPHIHSSLVKML